MTVIVFEMHAFYRYNCQLAGFKQPNKPIMKKSVLLGNLLLAAVFVTFIACESTPKEEAQAEEAVEAVEEAAEEVGEAVEEAVDSLASDVEEVAEEVEEAVEEGTAE